MFDMLMMHCIVWGLLRLDENAKN